MDIRGIDHVGVTVPDIEAATRFFVEPMDAEVLYDILNKSEPPRSHPHIASRLGVRPGTKQMAIRMLAMPNGPGLELFEYQTENQAPPSIASDFGWQHIAIYVDDNDLALDRARAAGATPFSEPQNLSGLEGGPGNKFVYCKTPWGSVLELISYPSPQPYEKTVSRRRWRP